MAHGFIEHFCTLRMEDFLPVVRHFSSNGYNINDIYLCPGSQCHSSKEKRKHKEKELTHSLATLEPHETNVMSWRQQLDHEPFLKSTVFTFYNFRTHCLHNWNMMFLWNLCETILIPIMWLTGTTDLAAAAKSFCLFGTRKVVGVPLNSESRQNQGLVGHLRATSRTIAM